MKLIVGLGNPGKQYAETRHNAGFMAVDELARRWQVAVDTFDKRAEALVGEAQRNGLRVFLLKPMTYMNLSGRSVAAFVRFFKLMQQDVIVLFDDMDLPIGRIRVRTSGSAGGQKGMADVIRHLGTDEIARVRIGIGRQRGGSTTGHVLSKFDARDREEIAVSLSQAADATECWLTDGTVAAMNQFNGQDPGDRASQN